MKYILIFIFISGIIAWSQPDYIDDIEEDIYIQLPFCNWMFFDDLELTSDQQKQFDKLHDELQKNQIALRAKIKSLRVELRGLFREDKPDQKSIEAKINEIGKIQTEMKLNNIGFWFNVNKLLTPEQQKVWKRYPLFGKHRIGIKGWVFDEVMKFPKKIKKKFKIFRERFDDD